jgi:hypothetical protein
MNTAQIVNLKDGSNNLVPPTGNTVSRDGESGFFVGIRQPTINEVLTEAVYDARGNIIKNIAAIQQEEPFSVSLPKDINPGRGFGGDPSMPGVGSIDGTVNINLVTETTTMMREEARVDFLLATIFRQSLDSYSNQATNLVAVPAVVNPKVGDVAFWQVRNATTGALLIQTEAFPNVASIQQIYAQSGDLLTSGITNTFLTALAQLQAGGVFFGLPVIVEREETLREEETVLIPISGPISPDVAALLEQAFKNGGQTTIGNLPFTREQFEQLKANGFRTTMEIND